MNVDLIFNNVTADQVKNAIEIEVQCFPPDEAASLDQFISRQHQAPDLFLGVYLASEPHRLIGYACSTLSPSSTLTHDSMSTHVPGSSSVCLHAVTVLPEYRRKGIASALMREYISRLERVESYKTILLITHDHLRSFYEGVEFQWLGKSSVEHGSQPWFEMRRELHPQPSSTQVQSLPPGVWEALQRPSGQQSNVRKLADIAGGLAEVTSQNSNDGDRLNKFDLTCPRDGCGSIILKSGVGKLVERVSLELDPPNQPLNLLPALPSPPDTAQWWLVTPSPMAFENIGFTRPVQSANRSNASVKKLKLLICAECDLGPLGWSEEDGSEFWLACDRVGYV
ncbi:acyl-CoA N-acyltransferase [Hygrophoropsis aurantiaca]|uniref:Acyl-CoA N-acyltransferase n=1 Tax=Hygrophoropsis aurantiaca TaxID=72124 RepID=A0ACB8AFT8_9AGAM|nr:acyl-CoA N-acyltransferase [Hygrophoropsis aurantiaca]